MLMETGNPDVMANVSADMVVGATTDVIAAEGLIVTAGTYACKRVCPQDKRA